MGYLRPAQRPRCVSQAARLATVPPRPVQGSGPPPQGKEWVSVCSVLCTQAHRSPTQAWDTGRPQQNASLKKVGYSGVSPEDKELFSSASPISCHWGDIFIIFFQSILFCSLLFPSSLFKDFRYPKVQVIPVVVHIWSLSLASFPSHIFTPVPSPLTTAFKFASHAFF